MSALLAVLALLWPGALLLAVGAVLDRWKGLERALDLLAPKRDPREF